MAAAHHRQLQRMATDEAAVVEGHVRELAVERTRSGESSAEVQELEVALAPPPPLPVRMQRGWRQAHDGAAATL